MRVGTAKIQVRIIDAQSLKQKRGILQSIIVRTRNKFNVAIAEIGDQNLWQSSEIGIAVVSSSSKHLDQQLQKVILFFEREPSLEVVEIYTEII